MLWLWLLEQVFNKWFQVALNRTSLQLLFWQVFTFSTNLNSTKVTPASLFLSISSDKSSTGWPITFLHITSSSTTNHSITSSHTSKIWLIVTLEQLRRIHLQCNILHHKIELQQLHVNNYTSTTSTSTGIAHQQHKQMNNKMQHNIRVHPRPLDVIQGDILLSRLLLITLQCHFARNRELNFTFWNVRHR